MFNVSITPRPAYRQILIALRSAPKRESGTIWRAGSPVVVTSAWRLEAPPRHPRDYIADEPYDYLGDPAYPPEPALAASYLL